MEALLGALLGSAQRSFSVVFTPRPTMSCAYLLSAQFPKFGSLISSFPFSPHHSFQISIMNNCTTHQRASTLQTKRVSDTLFAEQLSISRLCRFEFCASPDKCVSTYQLIATYHVIVK